MQGKYPIHRGSGALFDCFADFREAAANWYEPPYCYGVFGTETVLSFEREMAAREGARHALAFPSGMAAIAASLTALSEQGQTILLQDDIYAVTTMFAERQLHRFGVRTQTVDPADPGLDFDALHKQGARVLYLENPSYHDYRTLDLAPIIARAKQAGLKTIVDNSLPTFLNSKPLGQGADVSLYSASKYICGHGDSLLGAALVDDENIYRSLRDTQILMGYVTSPEDAALGLRGLETLGVRMRHQASEARTLARALAAEAWVKNVVAPGFAAADGQVTADERSFPVGTGLLAFTFREKLSDGALNAFTTAFRSVRIGYGWGSTNTIALPRNEDPAKTGMRLSVGMETADEIVGELREGMRRALAFAPSSAAPRGPQA